MKVYSWLNPSGCTRGLGKSRIMLTNQLLILMIIAQYNDNAFLTCMDAVLVTSEGGSEHAQRGDSQGN